MTPSGTVIPEWEGPHCWEVVAPLATIEGAVFYDADGNGVWDQPSETGMPGITVNLVGASTQSTTTGSNGEYSFTDLAAGVYRVYEDVPSGYLQTFPTFVSYVFTTTGYANYTDVDFGNTDTTCETQITTDTCFAGTYDDFVGAEPSSPDAALLAQMDMATYGANPYFDSVCINQAFGHTFSGCWPESCKVVGATLCMKLKATGSVPTTDKLYIGEWDSIGAFWAINLNDLEDFAGGDGNWNHDNVMTVCLDLKNLPAAGVGGPQNLLGGLQDGRLDVLISDDTEVDYLELIVETCCEATASVCGIYITLDTSNEISWPEDRHTFDVNLNNCSDNIIRVIANGFKLYSPDGAVWETPVYYSTGALEPYLDGGVFVNGLGADGISEDTITLGGYAMYEPGIPIGFDEVVVNIETRFDAAQVGKTFCIDSTYFPPSGTWMWAYTGGSLIPGWGGPYCWEIAPPNDECALYYSRSRGFTGHVEHYTEKTGLDGPPPDPQTLWTWTSTMDIDEARDFIYYSNADDIHRCGLDFDSPEVVVPAGVAWAVMDLVVDETVSPRMIYWVSGDFNPEIWCAPENANPGEAYCIYVPDWGIKIGGIAFDPENKEIYWTTSDGRVCKKDTSVWDPPNSKVVTLVDLQTSRVFKGIDLDVDNKMMYWADSTCKVILKKYMTHLDPPMVAHYSSPWFYSVQEVCQTVDRPYTLKLDLCNDRIYWVEDATVNRVDSDGSNQLVIRDISMYGYTRAGLALDLSCCDPSATSYFAHGDVNGNGTMLEVADLVYLVRYLGFHGPAPVSLYEADLNGDCVVDSMDAVVFNDFFAQGLSVFGPYGGYPVPTCQYPYADPAVDTGVFFDLFHHTGGSAVLQEASEGFMIAAGDFGGVGGVAIDPLTPSGMWCAEVRLPLASLAPNSSLSTNPRLTRVGPRVGQCELPSPFSDPVTVRYFDGDMVIEADLGFPKTSSVVAELYYGGGLLCADTTSNPSLRFEASSYDTLGLLPFWSLTNGQAQGGIAGLGFLTDWAYYRGEAAAPGIDFATLGSVDSICFTQLGGDNYDFASISRITMVIDGVEDIHILNETTVPSSCCVGDRGNVDGDPDDIIDISDLVYLVDYMFTSGPPPPCEEEADMNGDGQIDISDLVYLVDYMFTGGPAPVPCDYTPPPAKVGGQQADISFDIEYANGISTVVMNSPIDLRGIQLELKGTGPAPANLVGEHVDMIHGRDGWVVKVGLLDLDGGEIISADTRKVVRFEGKYTLEAVIVADLNARSITPMIGSVLKQNELPTVYTLSQNYPNPFNPNTSICFALPEAAEVRLEVFNLLGQRVTTLLNQRLEAGNHTAEWNSQNELGQTVASGVYFYRLETPRFTESKKMVLLK